jgi:restriction system protein
MNLPKYHETFIPILETLSHGKPVHRTDLSNQVFNKYYAHLPEELLNKKLKTGESLLFNRIGWGKSYLKQGYYLKYPERGLVQITPKGMEALSNRALTLKQLKTDPDFLAQRKNSKIQKQNIENDFDNNTPQDSIESGISAIEAQVKIDLLEKLKTIDAHYFEKIILKLLKRMRYGEFLETPKSHDGGIDGIINQDPLGLEKIYVQAKRYDDNKVREKDIRNFIGAMSGDTSKGVFVTTSSFDDAAKKKALSARHVISLIDGKKLVELMFAHNVGIKTRETYEIKELDLDFFEEV